MHFMPPGRTYAISELHGGTAERIRKCAPAGIEVIHEDPLEFADDIIGIFSRAGRTCSRERLDWYYGRCRSQPILSWMLRSRQTRKIVGLLSAVPRSFRRGSSVVRAGVLGNFFVDEDARPTLGAIHLMRAAQGAVLGGTVDLLFGFPGALIEPLLLGMGFQLIDYWQTSAYVRSSGPLLRATIGPAATVVSPLLDIGFKAMQAVRGASVPCSSFDVFEVADCDVRSLRPGQWSHTEGQFELDENTEFLESHYLHDSYKKHRILGITDGGSMCGYVVVNATHGGFHVCDCRTNTSRLSHAEAISAMCRNQWFATGTVAATTLRSTQLIRSLQDSGWVRVPVRLGGYACSLVGFWQPDHPLAPQFSNAALWNVYVGFNDV
jgi:hypothetical protein